MKFKVGDYVKFGGKVGKVYSTNDCGHCKGVHIKYDNGKKSSCIKDTRVDFHYVSKITQGLIGMFDEI